MQQDVGLSAVKLVQDVGGGDQVTFAIDEEAVAVEKVMNSVVGRGLIDGVNDGADRVPESFAVRELWRLGRCGDRDPEQYKGECHQRPGRKLVVSFHFENRVEIELRQTLLGNHT